MQKVSVEESNSTKHNSSDKEEEDSNYYPINNEFKIDLNEKLGKGSFGHIYKCWSTKTSLEYAAKFESTSATTPQLINEYKILQSLKGAVGIPKVYLLHNNGLDTILIINCLGPNWEDILKDTKAGRFSIKCSWWIIEQVWSRWNYIHDFGVVHRDVKPENLAIGYKGQEDIVYLIDYGLSRRYIDSKTQVHIPFKEGRTMTGTVKYCSWNTHKGYEQSRRDDWESLYYIWIYFIKGSLPWEGLKTKTKEEMYQKILELKEANKPNVLWNDLPREIINFYDHIVNLDFLDRPNYFYWNGLLRKMIEDDSLEKGWDWLYIDRWVEPLFMIREIKEKKELMRIQDNDKKDEQNIKEKETENKGDPIKLNIKKKEIKASARYKTSNSLSLQTKDRDKDNEIKSKIVNRNSYCGKGQNTEIDKNKSKKNLSTKNNKWK